MELKSINEIENMLVWLDGEISEYETMMVKPRWGRWMSAPNGQESRNDYAGHLAEREFLLKLKNQVLARKGG